MTSAESNAYSMSVYLHSADCAHMDAQVNNEREDVCDASTDQVLFSCDIMC